MVPVLVVVLEILVDGSLTSAKVLVLFARPCNSFYIFQTKTKETMFKKKCKGRGGSFKWI